MKLSIDPKNDVIIIVGPTAVGKTSLSLQIAEQLDSEIVSADSRQIYKLMDIGTAKPTPEEQRQVVHHFIDNKFPDEYYSAGQYARDARAVIDSLREKGQLPLVVGGSGLYIRALVDGFFADEIADEAVKENLKMDEQEKSLTFLYRKLAKVDPLLAQKIHPNDRQRIIRALEVWEVSGKPLSEFQQKPKNPAEFNPVYIGLTMDREQLYHRIERRVDDMLDQGFVDEVRRIAALGYSKDLSALQTVGYKEVFQYLYKEINYERMVELIKQKTRNYAKRQFTWFKKEKRINWFSIGEPEQLQSLATTIVISVNN